MVQNYVAIGHWYKIIMCIHEKVVYFFEPFGSRMRNDDPIAVAFQHHLHAIDEQWRMLCIAVKVQTDAVSCGIWQLVADHAFVAYVDSDSFGSGDFGAFFTSWLLKYGVSDLNTVAGSGSSRSAITKRNITFINAQRAELRERLLLAAKTGQLAWQNGPLIDIFVTDGNQPLSVEDFDRLDNQTEDNENETMLAAFWKERA